MLTGRRERAISLLRGLNPLLHPILLAAYPVLSLFQHNQAEVDLKVLWRSLAPAAASGAALFVLLMLLLKRGSKAGVLASLVVVAFFYYGRFHGRGSGWGLTDKELFPVWRAAIQEIAKCQNVAVKLGGLAMRLLGRDFHERPKPPSSEQVAAAWKLAHYY